MLSKIYTALRIYDTLTSQHHRKHYYSDKLFTHIAPVDRLLPFQYIRTHSSTFAQVIEICDLEDNTIRTINAPEISSDLNIVGRSNGTDVIIYSGETAISPLDPGIYYLKIQDGAGNTYYSETFKAFDFDEDCFLKLTAENNCDIGEIYHRSDVFKETLYLDLDLGKPIYKYQEESEEAYDKTLSRVLQRADKYYTLEFWAPEYLCDFLSLIKMYDTIKIETKDEGVMEIIEIDPIIEWSDQSESFAKVQLQFTINKITKTSCCDNIGSFDCVNTTCDDVVAIIEEGDITYTTPGMVVIPLVNGDRVLYDDGSGLRVGTFNSVTGLPEADTLCNTAGKKVFDLNTGLYFFFETSLTSYSIINRFNQLPILGATTDLVNVFAFGHAEPGFTVQLQRKCDGGPWIDVGASKSADDFNADGITAPFTFGDCIYRLKMTNIFCSVYSNIATADL